MRAGLIHNPRSQRNRRAAPLRVPEGLPHAAPSTSEELRAALTAFLAAGVDLVIVSGGDGTLREVTTMLPQVYGETLPALALLAAGNANAVAADVGAAGHGQAGLERLLAAIQDDRFAGHERRSLLRISWPDLALPPVYGFFSGAGVLTRATQHANEKILSRGVRHRASVIATVVIALWRAVQGRPGWLGAESMRMAADDGPAVDGARFIFLATTLHRMMLGLWPFWGGEGSRAPMHYLDIDSPPRYLWRSLWGLLHGRPGRRMLAGGYRSGRADSLRLTLHDPVIVDGEMFTPGPSGIVEISHGPTIEFVTP